MFFNRRQLRRWAASMLVLWLFGVWAGVANACLTSPSMRSADPSPSSGVPAVQRAAGHADHEHHGSAAHHHESGSPHHEGVADNGKHDPSLKSNCSDFCDKASVAVPSLKSALDDIQAHALQASALSVILPLPAYQPVEQWVARREGVRAPPIPIAFLRLAL